MAARCGRSPCRPDGQDGDVRLFDQSAILWALERGAALQVLRFHDGAVNAAGGLPDGRFVTAARTGASPSGGPGRAPGAGDRGAQGADRRLQPSRRTARASPRLRGTAPPGSRRSRAARRGCSKAIRATSTRSPSCPTGARHRGLRRDPAPLAEGRGRCASSLCRRRSTSSRPRRTARSSPRAPTASCASSIGGTRSAPRSRPGRPRSSPSRSRPDGAHRRGRDRRLGGRDRPRKPSVLFNLVGPGLPVWSLAFRPDGRRAPDRRQPTGSCGAGTCGQRRAYRRGRDAERPDDFLAGFTGERGAELFQACAACHTLTPDGGNRAGPTLHGVFGRRIATAPGYNYSEALKKLDIVWNAETIAKLFEVGPARYTRPAPRCPSSSSPTPPTARPWCASSRRRRQTAMQNALPP